MTVRRRILLPLLAAVALGVAPHTPAAHAQALRPTSAPADQGGREILVMLRLSPDHHRPDASYGGGYGDQTSNRMRFRRAQEIARRHGLELVGDGWPMPLIGYDCFVMHVRDGRTLEAATAEVSRDPLVAWSQPVQQFKAQGGERQRGEGQGDPLFRVQPAAAAWHLAALHRVATGRGVAIAVVDSKIDVNHPDLAGQFIANQDFVSDKPSPPERHGTGVAGIIAAKEGNGIGIAGVAPEARLMALRGCWQTEIGHASAPTVCDSLSLAKAIQFAIDHGAAIINLSLSGPPDRLLAQLLQVATLRHISVVAAYDPKQPRGGFPASAPGVTAVAGELPSFPPGVYGAPGRDIPTTEPGGKWNLVNGSSFAAAHMSGLLALVREHSRAAPRSLLVAAHVGGGMVDPCATLAHADRECACTCAPRPQFSASIR